jgi:DNA-binding response OmpR family regulator
LKFNRGEGFAVKSEKRLVLIAHRCVTFSSILGAAFERYGYDVALAENTAGISLALFSGKNPDVVVLSRNLPGEDSVAMVGLLRQDVVVLHAVKFVILIEEAVTAIDQRNILDSSDAIIDNTKGIAPERIVAHVENLFHEAA